MKGIGHSTCDHPPTLLYKLRQSVKAIFSTRSKQDGNTLPEEANLLHGEAAGAKAAASQRRGKESMRGTEHFSPVGLTKYTMRIREWRMCVVDTLPP